MTYMLAQTEAEIACEWKKYAGYTIRPLPSTVSYYESILNRYSDQCQSLIYGSTPEIRSIYQRQTKKVTLVDRSKLMANAMGKLTDASQALSANEKFIEKDWLSLSEYYHSFDVLIGDDAINMVTWENFEIFLQGANQLLKNNGLFICHLLVKPEDDLINQTFDELIDDCRQGLIKSKYDLASRLNFICYDRTSYVMGWQKTISTLGEARLQSISDYLDFITLFGKCNSQFYCPPQSLFEMKVKQYFHIDEIFYPHEHDYCLYEPVYLLRKK